MVNLFENRFFAFVFFFSSPLLLFASDWSNGTSTEVIERLAPQQLIVGRQNSNGIDDMASRTVREAGEENGANATADAVSVGNGTAEEGMSTTIDWWSNLATASPVVAQRDSVPSANASSASNSSAAVPSSTPSTSPNSTSSSSPANSTATKNVAILCPLQLFTVLVVVGATATIIF